MNTRTCNAPQHYAPVEMGLSTTSSGVELLVQVVSDALEPATVGLDAGQAANRMSDPRGGPSCAISPRAEWVPPTTDSRNRFGRRLETLEMFA